MELSWFDRVWHIAYFWMTTNETCSSATSQGDPRLRLEKYLAEIVCLLYPDTDNTSLTIFTKYLRLADLSDSAIAVWESTAKHYKTSYLAWISLTDVLMYVSSLVVFAPLIPSYRKEDQHTLARTVFSDLVYKNLDWPEAIWEAWISFEHLYGSVKDLEDCLDKVHRAQAQLSARRFKVSLLCVECNRVTFYLNITGSTRN
jgi:squamous cell carcinoma antigen recognized by T-cells 3